MDPATRAPATSAAEVSAVVPKDPATGAAEITAAEASAAVLARLGAGDDLDQSSPFFRASHATWKTTARIQLDYLEKSGVDAFLASVKTSLAEKRPGNPFRMLQQLAQEQADALDAKIAESKAKRREKQLVALGAAKRQRVLLSSGVGATAKALAEQFDSRAEGGGAYVRALAALATPTERLEVVSMLPPRVLLDLAALAHREGGGGGGGGGNVEFFVPADVAAALLTFDLLDNAVKREDDYYRVLFAQDRNSPELGDPHLCCLDVYSPASHVAVGGGAIGHPGLFADLPAHPAPSSSSSSLSLSPYPLMFREAAAAAHRRSAGAGAGGGGGRFGVVDESTFVARFNKFTEGALAGLDWTNVVAAGGSVTACLLDTHNAGSSTSSSSSSSSSCSSATSSSSSTAEFSAALASSYSESDVDLFLHGLSSSEANAKLSAVYACLVRTAGEAAESAESAALKGVRRAGRGGGGECSGKVSGAGAILVVRTCNAVTFVCDHPRRHVQVVLRLYASPAEILLGFDVDSCAVCFDGSKVLASPRAVRALQRGANLVDTGRRSYTYETRLLKYAKRGFAVAVPGLDRKRVDPAVLGARKFNEVAGLARLLLLEHKLSAQVRETADAQTPARTTAQTSAVAVAAAAAATTPVSVASLASVLGRTELVGRSEASRGRSYYRNRDGEAEFLHEVRQDNELRERAVKFETSTGLRVEDYNAVFLPWGPDWSGERVSGMLSDKYIYLNGQHGRAGFRVCPCFFYWGLEGVFRDEWHLGKRAQGKKKKARRAEGGAEEEEEGGDRYVIGPLKWLSTNPGRQRIGSFHPHEKDDWEDGAYLPAPVGVL